MLPSEGALMNLNFGPEWFWDQNRPEAIEARRQAAEFHMRCGAFLRTSLAKQDRAATSGNSQAKRFLRVLLFRCFRLLPFEK